MKKVFLFAASMMLCAGLAFAQTPKKNNNTETATKAVKTEQPAKRAETTAANALMQQNATRTTRQKSQLMPLLPTQQTTPLQSARKPARKLAKQLTTQSNN